MSDKVEATTDSEIEKQIEKEIEKGKLHTAEKLHRDGHTDKPIISFDFDGVICRPPFGFNMVLGRKLHDEELPESIREIDGPAQNQAQRVYLSLRGLFFENAKYYGRDPMEGAREGIIAVSQYRTPIIITGRSYLAKGIIEAWLKKYNMNEYFEAIYANNTALPTRQFKLHMLRRLNINEHVDDDGAITYYLATKGIKQLYLRNWPRNIGLPYPKNVERFTDITEIAQSLAKSKS
jgi:hypothetical protein